MAGAGVGVAMGNAVQVGWLPYRWGNAATTGTWWRAQGWAWPWGTPYRWAVGGGNCGNDLDTAAGMGCMGVAAQRPGGNQ